MMDQQQGGRYTQYLNDEKRSNASQCQLLFIIHGEGAQIEMMNLNELGFCQFFFLSKRASVNLITWDWTPNPVQSSLVCLTRNPPGFLSGQTRFRAVITSPKARPDQTSGQVEARSGLSDEQPYSKVMYAKSIELSENWKGLIGKFQFQLPNYTNQNLNYCKIACMHVHTHTDTQLLSVCHALMEEPTLLPLIQSHKLKQ